VISPWAHYGAWQPLSIEQAAALFAMLDAPWWIAGGCAIDLFVGRQTRDHGDTDVLLLRRDQLAAQRALAGWDLHAADPPGLLRPWREDEWLSPSIHDIWCRPTPTSPWALQLMLIENDGDRWLFRRDPSIGGPLSQLTRRSPAGIPYLAPEVQLLYKGRTPRPKDEADFAVALPLLEPASSAWLAQALAIHVPDSPWLARLR